MEMATSSSCHRTQHYYIDPENFSQFHNLPEKIRDRQAMLDGKWPGNGCEYCQSVEKIGGLSDRMMTLNREHDTSKIPPELFVDAQATSVTPIILEVYFNNTCNMSCLYCMPNISSKLNDEVSKFGSIEIGDFTMKTWSTNTTRYHSMVKNLWNYLATDNRYLIIKHFHILGGEAFLQKELDQSIDFWHGHPNPGLTINIISNLMIPHKKFKAKIDRFEQLVNTHCIYQLELTASLDCWGPEQEYVRYGLDLQTWQQNFEYMLTRPWIKPAIHSCVSSLTIKTLPVLLGKINQWNSELPPDRQVNYSFDLPIGKKQKFNGMHPACFGSGVFDQDFDHIIDIMPNSTLDQITCREQMIGQAKFVKNSVMNTVQVDTLVQYLNEIDRRRNLNWQQTFPWLAEFYNSLSLGDKTNLP